MNRSDADKFVWESQNEMLKSSSEMLKVEKFQLNLLKLDSLEIFSNQISEILN